MGERKVLNKRIDPDFDPKALDGYRRKTVSKNEVRMMLPMSTQCKTCGEFMYAGKKFNSRKETVTGEDYLGIKIHRFTMKCSHCCAEFSIKTDPKNTDYGVEYGVSRNYEPWKEDDEEGRARGEDGGEGEEEGQDALSLLERKAEESRRQRDIQDALEDIRALNQRSKAVDHEVMLKELHRRRDGDTETEDELAAKAAFVRGGVGAGVEGVGTGTGSGAGAGVEMLSSMSFAPQAPKPVTKKRSALVVKKKRRRDDDDDETTGSAPVLTGRVPPVSSLSALGGESDEEEDA